jgi:hypothetical protein
VSRTRIAEQVDDDRGRNVARLIYDGDRGVVYIETVGNHDGVPVCTAVRMDRARFAALVRGLGVM